MEDLTDAVGSADFTWQGGGSASYEAAKYNNGLTLDDAHYVDTAATFMTGGTTSLLLAGWFSPDTTGLIEAQYANLLTLNAVAGIGFLAGAGGAFGIRLQKNGGWWTPIVTGNYAAGTVIHICAYWESGDMRLALDGIEAETSTDSWTPSAEVLSVNSEGAPISMGSASGWVDEAGVWVDPPITTAEFRRMAGSLYNGGDGIFYNGTAWVESV